MKLLPEQISLLRKKEQELLKKFNEYKEYIRTREIVGSEETSISQVGDSIVDDQYQHEYSELNEIKELLLMSDYVTSRATDKIEIGTKFIIRFLDDEETRALLLTDASYGLKGQHQFISINSPVGAAVLGKKAGENFKAIIDDPRNNKKNIIKGKIEGIEQDLANYLHFIKETSFSNRRCKKDKAELSKIKLLPEQEKQTKLEERYAITASQRDLLLLEKERLKKGFEGKNSKSRLTYIDTLLKTAKIAEPSTDGTIGIGSTFDIILNTEDENAKTMHCELINRAISSELEDEYIEKISPLGHALEGLKAGSQITYRRNNKYQTAIITNVDRPEKENTPKQLLKN